VPSIRFCFLIVTLLACQGCATVRPVADPVDPVPVFLTDYGLHSSLILPTPDARYVEYCWGDWAFAVENRDWYLIDGPRALFLSLQSGFGRRFMPVDPYTGDPQVPFSDPSLKRLTKFYAARADVLAVEAQLDHRFQSDEGPAKINKINGITYVKDPSHYSLIQNCNHMTAALLRRLGCQVDGLVVGSDFSMLQPSQSRQVPSPPGPPTAVVSVQAAANSDDKDTK